MTPDDVAYLADTSVISGLELFMAATTIFSLRHVFGGRAVTLYIYNNAAPLAHRRGCPGTGRGSPDCRHLARCGRQK